MILTDKQVDYTYDKEIENVIYDIWEQTKNIEDFWHVFKQYVQETSIIYVVPAKTGRWKTLNTEIEDKIVFMLNQRSKELKPYEDKIFYHRWNGKTSEWVSRDEFFYKGV